MKPLLLGIAVLAGIAVLFHSGPSSPPSTQSTEVAVQAPVVPQQTAGTIPRADATRAWRALLADDTEIVAQGADGSTRRIAASGRTDLVYMATWCPYSKQLKRFLNDPQILPYSHQRTFPFLFDKNEWPTVEQHLKEEAETPGSDFKAADIPDLLDALKVKSGNAHVMDPKFFRDLPGNHFFVRLPSKVDSFPTIASAGAWTKTSDWIISTLGVPGELAYTTLSKYSPDKQ
jgi:hypothetical protein